MDAKLKEFLIKVSQDEELKKEMLERLGDDAKEATESLKKVLLTVAEFAQDKGVDIDFEQLLFNTLKIDDEALDEVAGGRLYLDSEGKMWGDCFCFGGGGGVANENQNTCGCVAGGGGTKTEQGQIFANENGYPAAAPLFCMFVGCYQ